MTALDLVLVLVPSVVAAFGLGVLWGGRSAPWERVVAVSGPTSDERPSLPETARQAVVTRAPLPHRDRHQRTLVDLRTLR